MSYKRQNVVKVGITAAEESYRTLHENCIVLNNLLYLHMYYCELQIYINVLSITSSH